jgi:hypothetical protein
LTCSLRFLGAILALGVVSLALAACGDSSDPPLSKVFKAAPWTASEIYSYDLRDQGNKLTGTCDLKTTPNAEPGQTLLEHLCGNGKGDRDDRSATVDAQTLLPTTTKRTIFGIDKSSTATFTSTYTYPKVALHADENGKTHDTVRDLPKASSDSPDPGYYDDESLFWVVRGVPLEKNWQGSYDDINASLGTVFSTTVKVESIEKITVPAGDFDAWRIRVETNDDTNYFWVDQAPPHEIVQATISDVTYKFTGSK